MIKIYFLEADQPLTKSFRLVDGKLEKSAYPHVLEVTSHEETICSVSELMSVLKKHADAGHCLLKGALARPLVKESRAGSTDSQATTQWLCLDLDGVHAPNIDTILGEMGLAGVDYGVQQSASSGFSPGLRCHIFLLVDRPTSASSIKSWLQHSNLTCPTLAKNLALSTTGMALKYPLDITVCQEDKLIYIGTPDLGPGIIDPYDDKSRYEVCTRGRDRAALPIGSMQFGSLRSRVEAKIDELRKIQGLARRKSWQQRASGGVQYLPNPDTSTVTGVKSERGYTYLNLNGGDSWGYYHPEDNATFIYNFKGEPTYLTKELLPEYWSRFRQRINTGMPLTSTTGAAVYLAFRDFDTAAYYNAIYNSGTDVLQIAPARSEKQLRDFMVQHGQMMGDFVPDWRLTWDPTSNKVLDTENKVLNTFVPSEVMKVPVDKTVVKIPTLTERVIRHMLAYDEDTFQWVINWIAFIYQYRQLSRVGLLAHGTEGTGKGAFFNRIITPLLGTQNVTSKRLEELESQFNGYVAERLFVMVDEIKVTAAAFHEKVTAKLKNMIVEESVSVRDLYKASVMRRNHANFFFASNNLDPLEITPADRRYTVAPPQQSPLITVMSMHEITNELPKEVGAFAHFLSNYKVDVDRAHVPLINDAKKSMIDLNRQTIDQLSDALYAGDMGFFVDALPHDIERSFGSNLAEFEDMAKYVRLLDVLCATGETRITRDELYILCRYCIGKNVPSGAHKFAVYLRHHRINLESLWRDGRSARGFVVPTTWSIPTTARLTIDHLKGKLI